MVSSYDNPFWEYHLPVNPPIQPGKDLDIFTGDVYHYPGPDRIDVHNVVDLSGKSYFVPRISEKELREWIT